jgi:hypothetical protein
MAQDPKRPQIGISLEEPTDTLEAQQVAEEEEQGRILPEEGLEPDISEPMAPSTVRPDDQG